MRSRGCREGEEPRLQGGGGAAMLGGQGGERVGWGEELAWWGIGSILGCGRELGRRWDGLLTCFWVN